MGEGQARKKSTKINFLGPETARWGGGLPREGVGVENFVPALESLSSLGFEERNLGYPGIFAGMSRTPGGVRKSGKEKAHKHKQIFSVTARAGGGVSRPGGGGSPDRWPGVKSLCAVCGTQGT